MKSTRIIRVGNVWNLKMDKVTLQRKWLSQLFFYLSFLSKIPRFSNKLVDALAKRTRKVRSSNMLEQTPFVIFVSFVSFLSVNIYVKGDKIQMENF